MLVLDTVILRLIIVKADGGAEEKLYVVTEADPEAAIIFALVVDLACCHSRPLGGLVAPVALPLLATIRVSDLDQSLFFAIFERYDLSIDQTVSMSINKASSLDS